MPTLIFLTVAVGMMWWQERVRVIRSAFPPAGRAETGRSRIDERPEKPAPERGSAGEREDEPLQRVGAGERRAVARDELQAPGFHRQRLPAVQPLPDEIDAPRARAGRAGRAGARRRGRPPARAAKKGSAPAISTAASSRLRRAGSTRRRCERASPSAGAAASLAGGRIPPSRRIAAARRCAAPAGSVSDGSSGAPCLRCCCASDCW